MGESKRRDPKTQVHKQSKRLLYLWDDVVPFTKLNPLFFFLIPLLLPSFLSFFFLSFFLYLNLSKKIIIIVYLFIRDSDLLFSLSIDGGTLSSFSLSSTPFLLITVTLLIFLFPLGPYFSAIKHPTLLSPALKINIHHLSLPLSLSLSLNFLNLIRLAFFFIQ